MTLLLCIVFCQPCHAETKQKVLRVGYTDYHGFINKGPGGHYIGYGVDYLRQISRYCDYTFKYEKGTWTENLEKLKRHEIDLVCTAQYTRERAREYAFTKCALGYTIGLFYTNKNSDLVYEDFASFQNIRVAMLKKNAMNAMFAEYARNHGFKYTCVYYDNMVDCMKAVQKGNVDAVVGESLCYNNNLKLIGKFGADPFFAMSYKGSPYLEDIDYALSMIKMDTQFEDRLFEKYYGSSVVASNAEYTIEEQEYIRQAKVIKVGTFDDCRPFFYKDEESGKWKGIYVDYLKAIEKESGLQFKLMPLDPKEIPENAMMTGKFDLIMGVQQDYFQKKSGYITSVELNRTELMAMVQKERKDSEFYLKGGIVAVPGDHEALKDYLKRYYPRFKQQDYPNGEACVQAVQSGEADIFFQNTLIIADFLKSPYHSDLAMVAASNMEVRNAIAAVGNPENERLMEIINKSVYNMGEAKRQSIIFNNTEMEHDTYSIQEYLYKNKVEIILLDIILGIILVAMVGISHISEKNENKLRKANTQLQKAIREAESANNAKTDFLSRISHDIRTPMNSIIGLTALAYDEVNDPDYMHKYLENIHESSTFLLGLINDVLDMAKIESGELKLHPEYYAYREFVSAVKQMFEPLCKEKGLEFCIEGTMYEFDLLVDKLRINQIFFNVISNAIKFTPEGGKIICREENARVSESYYEADLVIMDNGIGMSEEYQKHLFEPFSQEKNDLTNTGNGSGLGLSIVKSLVEDMHGEIKVESEIGVGTRVQIHLALPIRREAGSLQKERETKCDGFKGTKVLLVEDHEMNAMIARRILEKKEMEVVVAKDGRCAVEAFAESEVGEYQIILMDIRMPNMDGLEATRRIRELEREDAQKIPIVAMTADAFMEDQKIAHEAGMNAHLAKPIVPDKLYEVIREFIRQ